MNPKRAVNRLAAAADIPVSAVVGLPEIRITAMHTVVIEPHRGIRSFAADCVFVESGAGILCVRGHELVLKNMNRKEIRLVGEILAVERMESHAD